MTIKNLKTAALNRYEYNRAITTLNDQLRFKVIDNILANIIKKRQMELLQERAILDNIIWNKIIEAKGTPLELDPSTGLKAVKEMLYSFNSTTRTYQDLQIAFYFKSNEKRFTAVYNFDGSGTIEYFTTKEKAAKYVSF